MTSLTRRRGHAARGGMPEKAGALAIEAMAWMRENATLIGEAEGVRGREAGRG
jgi:hypothetical protein